MRAASIIIDKYKSGAARYLTEEEAIQMFVAEFSMTEKMAADTFRAFDEDGNGQLTLLEFEELYGTIGLRADKLMNLFAQLNLDDSSRLNFQEIITGMAQLNSNDLSEEDLTSLKSCIEKFDGMGLHEFKALLKGMHLAGDVSMD